MQEIKDYIEKYCHIEKDGSIVSNNNNTYIENINWLNELHSPSNIFNFLIEHKIYLLYSYKDFRKTMKSRAACCGFSESEQKWYGWTNLGFRGFGIGDTYFNYLSGKPAKNLNECRKLAFYAVQELS